MTLQSPPDRADPAWSPIPLPVTAYEPTLATVYAAQPLNEVVAMAQSAIRMLLVGMYRPVVSLRLYMKPTGHCP